MQGRIDAPKSPSSLHEILIDLFRERPALVQELLRPTLGDQVPPGAALEALADALLGFEAPADLEAWLEQAAR